MERVQKREGLVCICAECGAVIQSHGCTGSSGTPLVSHGICAACSEKLYGFTLGGSAAAPDDGS